MRLISDKFASQLQLHLLDQETSLQQSERLFIRVRRLPEVRNCILKDSKDQFAVVVRGLISFSLADKFSFNR